MDLSILFDKASSLMTLLSFLTFVGIVGWAYLVHNDADFSEVAALPFADEEHGHG